MANVFVDPMVGLLHVCAYEMEGVGGGQQWKEFVLLGLKIQNLWFRFTNGYTKKEKKKKIKHTNST